MVRDHIHHWKTDCTLEFSRQPEDRLSGLRTSGWLPDHTENNWENKDISYVSTAIDIFDKIESI